MIDQNNYCNMDGSMPNQNTAEKIQENSTKIQLKKQNAKTLFNKQKFYDNKENLQVQSNMNVILSQNSIPTESSKYSSQYNNMSLEKLLKNKSAHQVAQELTYGYKKPQISRQSSVQTSQQSLITQSINNNQFLKKINSNNINQGFYNQQQGNNKVLMEITQQSLNQLENQKKLQTSVSEKQLEQEQNYNYNNNTNNPKNQQYQQQKQCLMPTQQSLQVATTQQLEEQQIIMQKIKNFRESLQIAKGGKIEDACLTIKQLSNKNINQKNNDTLLSNAFSKMQTPTNHNERLIAQQLNSNNLFTLSEDTQFKRKKEEEFYQLQMPMNKIQNSQFTLNSQQFQNTQPNYNNSNIQLHQSKSTKIIQNTQQSADPLLHLYEDAKIRNSKKIEIQKNNQEQLKNQISNNNKQNLEKQNKFLMQKFVKDFEEVLDHMFEFTYENSNKNQQISFEQYVQILHSMRFIRRSDNLQDFVQTEDNENILQIWEGLQFQQKVYTKNLLIILLAILKLYNSEIDILKSFKSLDHFDKQNNESSANNNQSQIQQNNLSRDFTFDSFGNLMFNTQDNKKINNRFQSLYKSYQQNKSRKTYFEEFSHQPKISEISALLAQHAKQIVINEMQFQQQQYIKNGENFQDLDQQSQTQLEIELQQEQQQQQQLSKKQAIPINEILLYKKSKSLQEINLKRQQQMIQEVEKCTFKPKVLQSQQSVKYNRKSSQNKQGVHRSIQLYQLSKNSNKQQRQNKTSNEIEYEKQCDECTFQPEINQYQPQTNYMKTQESDKNITTSNVNTTTNNNNDLQNKSSSVQKAVERMKSARLQKLQNEEIKNLGSTYNDSKRDNLMRFVQQKDQFELDLLRSYRFQIRKDQLENMDDGEQQQLYPEEDFQNYNEQHSLQYTDNLTQQKDQSKQCDQIKQSTQLETQETQTYEQYGDQQQEDAEYETIQNLQDYGITRNDIPLLLVDVHIAEGKTDKIMIFEGDKAEDLAQKFAEKHGLEEQMKGKLVELLVQQMSGILCKIDEEEEEDHQIE